MASGIEFIKFCVGYSQSHCICCFCFALQRNVYHGVSQQVRFVRKGLMLVLKILSALVEGHLLQLLDEASSVPISDSCVDWRKDTLKPRLQEIMCKDILKWKEICSPSSAPLLMFRRGKSGARTRRRCLGNPASKLSLTNKEQ